MFCFASFPSDDYDDDGAVMVVNMVSVSIADVDFTVGGGVMGRESASLSPSCN